MKGKIKEQETCVRDLQQGNIAEVNNYQKNFGINGKGEKKNQKTENF